MSRQIRAIRLRRLEGQLGEVAYQITKLHFASFQPNTPHWQPAMNVFQCAFCFRVCLELAGVDPETIQVELAPGRLRISGERFPFEPSPEKFDGFEVPPKEVRVLAMEISYGSFERSLDLPEDVDLRRVTTEWLNGVLWVHLPRLPHA